MSEMKIHNLWPINIGEFHNPEHQKIKKNLISFFNEYEKNKPEGNHQLSDKDYVGNYNLYQSDYYLHTEKNEALQNLLKFIAQSILSLGKVANKKRLEISIREISTCSISGAVGTFANIDPNVEKYVAKKLKLNIEPISTQVIPRDRHAQFFSTLGIIAS